MRHFTYQDLFPLSCCCCSQQRKHWGSEPCTCLKNSPLPDYNFWCRQLGSHDSFNRSISCTFGLWIQPLHLDPISGCCWIPPSGPSCLISSRDHQFYQCSVLDLYVWWCWLVFVLCFASQTLLKGGYCLLWSFLHCTLTCRSL